MKPSIELHIEELVLTGVSATDSFRVGQALQEKLEQLLQEHGLPPAFARGASLRTLRAGDPGGTGRHDAGGSAAGLAGGAGGPAAGLAGGVGANNPERLGSGVADAVFSGFKNAQL
jgi:hypothetical protein